jgi:hypothetical protein
MWLKCCWIDAWGRKAGRGQALPKMARADAKVMETWNGGSSYWMKIRVDLKERGRF